LRIPEKYQKYRYAKKTQISLGSKKYRYVGDSAGFARDVETTKSDIGSILY
jgi:hypothetical protein